MDTVLQADCICLKKPTTRSCWRVAFSFALPLPARSVKPSVAIMMGGTSTGKPSFAVVRCCASSKDEKTTQQEFLEMAWQGIVSSPEVSKLSKHQIMETEHLTKELLEQKHGLARRIFSKTGVDNTCLFEVTDKFIQRQT